MQKPSSAMPLAIAALAVVGLVFANVMANKNRPKTSAEIEREQQEAQDKLSSPAPTAPPADAGDLNPTDLKSANDLAGLGPDITLPGGEAAKSVTLGYEWTPELQSDPGALAKIVEKLRADAPSAQIRLVNVDENPAAPRGISVNNKVVAPLGPDGNLSAAAANAAVAEIKKAK